MLKQAAKAKKTAKASKKKQPHKKIKKALHTKAQTKIATTATMNLQQQRKKMRQFSTATKPGGKDTVDWSAADPEAITKAMLDEQQGDDEDKPQFWASWTSSQKKDYNEWLFRKMRPIVRRGLYVALAAQGFQPADEKVPPDEVMTEHFIETLVAHSLIIPKSQKNVSIPDPSDTFLNPHQDCIDDLWFIMDAFEIIPRDRLKQFKKGYINPFIEFREFDFETDAFNSSLEMRLTPEQIEKDGPIYTVRDALETCLKMVGIYDIQYFQDDPEIDAEMSLPHRPQGESKFTAFQHRQIKMYPYHEDPNAPLTRLADEFERDYLSGVDDIVQLHELHNQFYRHDVASTLHPDVAEIYDAIIDATDQCTELNEALGTATLDRAKFNTLITPEQLMVMRGVIRDFYLQTLCYEDYLSSAGGKNYYHVNVDFDEQLYNAWQEQGEYNSEVDEAEEREFLDRLDEQEKAASGGKQTIPQDVDDAAFREDPEHVGKVDREVSNKRKEFVSHRDTDRWPIYEGEEKILHFEGNTLERRQVGEKHYKP